MEPWPAMLVLPEGYSLRPFKATLFGEKRGWDGYYHWCSENKSNSWKQRVLWWAIYKELKEVESWVKDLNLPKFVGISMVLTEMELRSILFSAWTDIFLLPKVPFLMISLDLTWRYVNHPLKKMLQKIQFSNVTGWTYPLPGMPVTTRIIIYIIFLG